MTDIIACTACQTKNRLGTPPTDQVPRCGQCQAPLPWLVAASDADFDRALDAPTPVLVDLWAPWCGPCLALAPVLQDIAAEHAGRLKVVKVDTDRNPATARRFQVQSIPMLLIFQGGERVETLLGLQTRRDLGRKLSPYLAA